MSLARTLMNGGFIGSLNCDINPARYGHAQGATVIAMESVEELHEIFLESYNYEQAELAAATEGVALEGSQYEAVAEAAIGDMFKKIKDFFVKLWNKVKAFFHEVRKYIDSIFMSGKEFAKKYQKEIAKLDNLKDFSFKMFKYNNNFIDIMDSKYIVEPDELMQKMMGSDINSLLDKAANISADAKYDDEYEANRVKNGQAVNGKAGVWTTDGKGVKTQKWLGDPKAEQVISGMDETISFLRSDRIDDAVANQILACKYDDVDTTIFSMFRNGAESQDDKEEIDLTLSDINKFAQILIDSKADQVDKASRKLDTTYSKTIKAVDKAANEFGKNNSKLTTKAAELMRAYSSVFSKCQTIENKIMSGWKDVIKERDGAYKSCIMAAFSNNRKNSKNK